MHTIAPRVRFAPSPTGPLHIGGIRTALFNYLFAKKYDGTFILRIEDTDQKRWVAAAENYITEALEWCGITYDEGPDKPGKFGPYRQSQRKTIYKKYIDLLLSKGWAYYAFDTPEELEAVRNKYKAEGKTFMYGLQNRSQMHNALGMSEKEIRDKLSHCKAYVIRFKIPKNEKLVLQDAIRGKIEVNTNTLDDKILFKSDGMPTYHFANVIDDKEMEITHVIRGEEWLPSLALHVLLYRAMDWNAPIFAHLPLILKPNGKGKLSKRDGAKGGFPVFPLPWIDATTQERVPNFQETGYLPESLCNTLALLGWNPSTDQEIFDLDQLIQEFDLAKVHKAGAKFDPEKAKWFQQQHLSRKPDSFFVSALELALQKKQIQTNLDQYKIVSSVRSRAIFATDIWNLTEFLFEAPTFFDPKALKKIQNSDFRNWCPQLIDKLESIADFTADQVRSDLTIWAEDTSIKFGKLLMAIRLSLVGKLQGPDVFCIIEILGKVETMRRISACLKTIPIDYP